MGSIVLIKLRRKTLKTGYTYENVHGFSIDTNQTNLAFTNWGTFHIIFSILAITGFIP